MSDKKLFGLAKILRILNTFKHLFDWYQKLLGIFLCILSVADWIDTFNATCFVRNELQLRKHTFSLGSHAVVVFTVRMWKTFIPDYPQNPREDWPDCQADRSLCQVHILGRALLGRHIW